MYTIRRDEYGHAVAIERDGYTVLHLQPGTERNEQEVEGIVARLNDGQCLRAVLTNINRRIIDQRRWGNPVNLEIARELQAVADEIREALSATSEPCQTCGVNIESICPIGDCESTISEPIAAERVRKLWNSQMAAGAYRAGIRDTIEAIGWKITGINGEGGQR